jgi:hypothetical protein
MLLAVSTASSQYILIERTDVDSSRSTFITASYKFGMDIYAEDVSNCNGVAFEMRYNKKDFIKYSGYDKGDFKNVNITVLDDTDYMRVIVNAGSGLQADEEGVDNPMIVHLEFVVLQSAPDFESDEFDVEYSFLAPIATYFSEEGIQSLFLEANPVYYKIHGFINVYPGDTDNNGIVDYLDYEPINRFMSLGSKTKNMRSFKRQNASSVWVPQRVLKWDSAMVTYADCDGNSDITMQDALIVTYNLNKTHNIGGKIGPKEDYDRVLYDIAPRIYSDNSTESYELEINSYYDILAATGSIELLNPDDIEIVGIENGEIFKSRPFLLEHENNSIINFAVGSNSKDEIDKKQGTLVNIIYRKKHPFSSPSFNFSGLRGITNNGAFVSLNKTTSVNEESLNKDLLKNIGYNCFLYKGDDIAKSIRIYDINGDNIKKYDNVKSSDILFMSDFASGIYFAVIEINKNTYVKKINITN